MIVALTVATGSPPVSWWTQWSCLVRLSSANHLPVTVPTTTTSPSQEKQAD